MAPNSRPPLTSRIRASFDGKRTKSEVTSPVRKNGFMTQDPDGLRSAIDEAINSETFQKAIAANLAKLIKPSIKSALDTIQPVVEAVYAHELLLRKTNQSVEDILIRLDERAEFAPRRESINTHRESLIEPLGPEPSNGVPTILADEGKGAAGKAPAGDAPVPRTRAVSSSNLDQAQSRQSEANHAKTTPTLAELSSSIEAGKAEMLQGISDVETKLRWASDSVESLKSASEQSNTTMAVLQAQLDQLKDDIGQVMTAVGTDLPKALNERSGAHDTSLESHTTKLDTISTDLAALKGRSDTVDKIDAVSTELASLKASVEAGIASNSEGFTGLGSQISTVLTTLEGHTGTLGEIKDKGPHPEIISALQQSNDSHAAHAATLEEIKDRSVAAESGSPETTAALQDLKSDLASLRENIEAGLTSNNENVTGVGAKVDNVLATIESHKASDPSADILAAVQQSNESHTSHAAVLEELKSREVAPAAAIDTSELTAQLNTIAETINTHTATLDDIKTAAGSHAAVLEEVKSREVPPAPALDTSDLTAQLNTIADTVNSHTATLDEIKTANGSHAVVLEELKSREAAPAAALDTSDLSAQLHTIAEAASTHTAILDEIKTASGSHTAALESHGTSLEGLRFINAVPETDAEASNIAPLEAHMNSIVSILEEHSEALSEIKAAASTHTTALEDHGMTLEEIKSLSKDVPPPVDNSTIEAQVAALATTLELHTSALDEIKATGSGHTAALEGHGSTLEGIKSLGAAPVPVADSVDLSGLDGHIGAIIAILEAHTAALEDLKTSSGAHTTALEQSRSVSDTPLADNGAAALEGQINTIIATLQAHSTALEDIGTANNSHTATLGEIDARGQTHASTLDEIKAAAASHSSALDDIKSTPVAAVTDNASLTALEAQIGSIISTLDAQSAALKDLRPEAVPSNTEVAMTESGEGLSGILTTIVEMLEMHTTLLNEMKEDVSAEILTTLHDLSQTQANQSNLLVEIRESDLSDEVLTLLHASGESHASHTAALEKIEAAVQASNDSHAAHAISLDEVKSRSADTASIPIATPAVDLSGMETKIDTVIAALEEHKATLEEIKGTTNNANELHAGHTAALDELKSRSVEPVAAPAAVDISGVETKIDGIIGALEEHKAALSEIKDTASASHELHATQGAALDEIKSRSIDPTPTAAVDLSGLEAQLSAVTAALEEHKATLSEIKDLHTAQGASLEEIKARSADFTAPTVDLSSLETQLGAITSALEEHRATLSEVKELHNSHTASLDEIKAHSIESVSAPATDLSGLETQLSTITAVLEEHKATLSDVKATSLAAYELHTAQTASLDDIKERSIEPPPMAPAIDISSLEAQIGSINSSIDEIKAKSLEPAASAVPVDLSGLETQLAGLASMLEEHKATLSEVKATSLAAHDMHAAQVTSLDEIKSRSAEPSIAPVVDLSSLEAQLVTIAAALDEHKTMLSTIIDATAASNASHLAHASILSDIKDASLVSNESHIAHATALSDIKDATSSWNEAHSANAFTLAEIKDTTHANSERHVSHAVALSELKDATAKANEAHASHTAAFADLKENSAPVATEMVDLSPVEGHLTSIISTLEGQAAALAEIKEAASSTSPELLASIKDSHDLLTSHTTLLDIIKDSSSHEDILTNISELKSILTESQAEHGTLIKDLHTETKDSHSHLAEAIGALALGGAAGVGASALMSEEDNSSEKVFSEVQAMRTILDETKEKMDSIETQIGINHTTVTTSLNTLSDELKAEIDATGTHVTDHVLGLPSSINSVDLGPLNTSISDCAQNVKIVETKIEGLEASVKQTGSFVVGLYEGVHLNDTGVGQLQEQLVSWVVKGRGAGADTPVETLPVAEDKEKGLQVPMEIDEATWFKKKDSKRSISPSPLREVETVSPPTEPEVPAIVEEEKEEEEEEKEEMPSIDAVLEDATPEVEQPATIEREVVDEEPTITHDTEPIATEENLEAIPFDTPALVEESTAKEVEETPVESETLPSDESRGIEDSQPTEPEITVQEAFAPEPPEESIPVESNEPEVHTSEDQATMVEEPSVSAPEPLEESLPVETDTPELQTSDKQEVIAEEPSVSAPLEESGPVESEPTTEELHEVEEHVPVEEEIHPTEEPISTEIQPAIEESTILEDSEELAPVESEILQETQDVDEPVPIEAEPSTAPDTDKEIAPVEPDTIEAHSEEPEEQVLEEAIAPDHVEDSTAETSVPVESKDIEEPTTAQEEEASLPHEEEVAPVESEEPTTIEEVEESTPLEPVDEIAPVEHEIQEEETQDEVVPEPSVPEAETIEEADAVELEEPAKQAQDIETPSGEPEALVEDTPSEEPNPVLESAADEPIIEHESLPTEKIQEEAPETVPAEPEIVAEETETQHEDSTPLEAEPSVEVEEAQEPASDDVKDEILEPESEPTVEPVNEETIPESEAIEEESHSEPIVEDAEPEHEIEAVVGEVKEEDSDETAPVVEDVHEDATPEIESPAQLTHEAVPETKEGAGDVEDDSPQVEDATTVDEPVVQEPAVDEPVVDEPAINEPAADEPVVQKAEASDAVDSHEEVPQPGLAEPDTETDAAANVEEGQGHDAEPALESAPEPPVIEDLPLEESSTVEEDEKPTHIDEPEKHESTLDDESLQQEESYEPDAKGDEAAASGEKVHDSPELDVENDGEATPVESRGIEPEIDTPTPTTEEEAIHQPAVEEVDDETIQEHEHTPVEIVADNADHYFEEASELGQESPLDPEPTPAEPTVSAPSTTGEDTQYPESTHYGQASEAQSDMGGTSIDDLKDDSHITEGSHTEPPSSPFIEEPAQIPAHFGTENSHEDEPTNLEFEEPHPSPVSEHHPSSLIHDTAIEDIGSVEEGNGVPLTSHEEIEEPIVSLPSAIDETETVQDDDEGGEEEGAKLQPIPAAEQEPVHDIVEAPSSAAAEDDLAHDITHHETKDVEEPLKTEHQPTHDIVHHDESVPDKTEGEHHLTPDTTHHDESHEETHITSHDNKVENDDDEPHDSPAFSGGFA
ncbi:hypothetical protein EG329_013822 [Mollisiaceae sp. DMI_Dod_QoI]|nr:hypothetical protein EG329_013822 [Helotiales sp. DMI_Dod_QoI]